MQPWLWGVLLCAVLLTMGFLVDRRARAKRAGLVRPADTRGRSKADPLAGARSVANVTERAEGRVDGWA